MRFARVSLLCIFLSFNFYEAHAKSLVTNECTIVPYPGYAPGMFSVFCTVAGFLHLYNIGQLHAVKIDFGTNGWYYDPGYGPNWWTYYCDPIDLGNKHKKAEIIRIGSADDCRKMAALTEFHLSRKQVNNLIKKYIHIKAFLAKKVETFIEHNFKKSYVIGVHYRGTDKSCEAPRVSYEQAFQAITEQIKVASRNNYKIFAATDEENFLQALRAAFPNKVISLNSYRSLDNLHPVHMSSHSPFAKGEEALMDVLLLSRCHVLIRTSSNLSLWASYFNPTIPEIMLNQRFGSY